MWKPEESRGVFSVGYFPLQSEGFIIQVEIFST